MTSRASFAGIAVAALMPDCMGRNYGMFLAEEELQSLGPKIF